MRGASGSGGERGGINALPVGLGTQVASIDGFFMLEQGGHLFYTRSGAFNFDEVGTLSAGTLEMSNVDLALEFTNLIIAQRGFQANSRIITVSDELLGDLVNLKR